MGQLLVVVEAVFVVAESQRLMPGEAGLLPGFEPAHFVARAHKELHLHLLEFAHAEDELARHDLVAEGLTDLRDTEGHLHAARLLDVQEVDKNALGGLGTQINGPHAAVHVAQLRAEHQVELAHLGPVFGAGNRAGNLAVDDDLAQFRQVVLVQRFSHPVVHLVPLCLVAEHVRVGCAELRLVERIAETFATLLHLLVVLLLEFCQIILDQDICTVSFLGILVVDQRVVEGAHVARGLPDTGVHEDGGIEAHDVVVQVNHGFPPVFLDIVLHFHAVLAVVIHGAQTVVDLAGGENEPVFLGVRHEILESFFLCH